MSGATRGSHHGTIVFGREKQNGIVMFDFRPKANPTGRRLFVEIFIVERQVAYLDEGARETLFRPSCLPQGSRS
jgi:hypothetical protein